MENSTWLTAFKTKLRNHALTYDNNLKPLAYYEITDSDCTRYRRQLKHYSDSKLIKITDQIGIDLFNIGTHLNAAAQPYLESLLLQKAYAGKPLVVENEILDKFAIGYHVVYLDAIVDFAQNYYDDTVQTLTAEDPQYQKRYAANPAGCLIFLNADNSYFLALPCMLTDYIAAKFDNARGKKNIRSYLTCVPATIKQIHDVLKPVPLIQLNGIYPFMMQFSYMTTSLRIADSTPTPQQILDTFFDQIGHVPYEVTYAGEFTANKINEQFNKVLQYYFKPIPQKIKSDKQSLAIWNYNHDDIMHTLIAQMSQLQDSYIAHYLKKHCQIRITATGDIKCQFDLELPKLTQLINRHIQRSLHHFESWTGLPNYALTYSRVTWHHAYQTLVTTLMYDLSDQPAIALTSAEPITTTCENVALPAAKAPTNEPMKPLVKSHGMLDVLLSVTDASQKYYIYQHKLVTLTDTKTKRNDQISHTMEGRSCDL